MADFRKWLYAFAVVALLAGLTVPASAQIPTFQTCVGGAVNPTVRAEGYTELAGDITITCSGGTITAPGNTIPAVTIDVSMNTIITSKLTSTSFTPNFNEALLLIDEPGLGATGSPLLNCGNAGAPFTGTGGTGNCQIVNDGAGNGLIYNGAAGHPNVFQGRQVVGSNNQIIQFIGIPLDGGSHTLRITNLRANAVFLSGGRISNGNFGLGLTFQSFVTFTSPNSVNAQLINVTNGSIRNGLDTVSGSSAGPYLQCTFTSARQVSGGSVTLLEGFPSAWKVRNWRQIQDNGTYVGSPDWQYTPGVNVLPFTGTPVYTIGDMDQNVPNGFYGSESGFMFPPPPNAVAPPINPPPGISNATGVPAGELPFTSNQGVALGADVTGISTAGTVTNGTRFAIKFANIPGGTTITVPNLVPLINVSGGNSNQTGVLMAVGNPDANGAGGTVGVGGTTTSSVNFTIIYEVVFDDPLAIESATIPVTANVSAFDGTNPQVNVTATAQAGFAPWYDNGAGSTAGQPLLLGTPLNGTQGPIARFVTGFFPTPPVNLFSFNRCACDMLFPWVVGDANFTTSIVVANTSLDPGITFGFTAAPQSGTVQFWFFGTSGVSFNPASYGSASGPSTVIGTQITSVSIDPGSYVAFVISPSNSGASSQTAGNGLKPIAGNFAGYVIAQSQFQYCHGIASISAPGFSPQSYLGLVLDKGSKFNFNNIGAPSNGANPFGLFGQELPRTNQAFADELEN